jgi:hypothetical protein
MRSVRRALSRPHGKYFPRVPHHVPDLEMYRSFEAATLRLAPIEGKAPISAKRSQFCSGHTIR